jgi:uncharacterized membrane protein YsdA (DUF1294 family)
MNLKRFCYLLLVLAGVASMLTPSPFVTAFISINVLTLLIYGVDKRAARKAGYRVPESTLLFFGVIGGWPGAMLGQQLFRHKTQKQPFKTYFLASVMVNIVVMAALYQVYPMTGA